MKLRRRRPSTFHPQQLINEVSAVLGLKPTSFEYDGDLGEDVLFDFPRDLTANEVALVEAAVDVHDGSASIAVDALAEIKRASDVRTRDERIAALKDKAGKGQCSLPELNELVVLALR